MCNLYSSYTTQEAMRRAFEVARGGCHING